MRLLLCIEVDLDGSAANRLTLEGNDCQLSIFVRTFQVDETIARVPAIERIYRDVHFLPIPARRQ